MTSVLVIAIPLTSALAVCLFRRELLASAHAIAAHVLEFKKRLRQFEDDLWRQ